MEGFGDDEIESVLYIGREVSGMCMLSDIRLSQRIELTAPICAQVYKIPPLKKNEGHRAQEWGDLGQPLWKGRLRILERSKGVSLQFEDSTTG